MRNSDAHLGDDAELYALGDLDDVSRLRAENHLRACSECARRVGEAEAAITTLAERETLPGRPAELDRRMHAAFARSRSPMRWIAAVAAALVLALLSVIYTRLLTVHEGSERVAMQAMLHGHFLHASFTPVDPSAPEAKAIYARDGSWLYVLVAAGPEPVDVAIVSGGKQTIVASLPASTQTRAAFSARPPGLREIDLIENGRTVSRVRTDFAKRLSP